MTSKIKNIIIFIVIAVVLILVYVFFFKKAPDTPNLTTTSTTTGSVSPEDATAQTDSIGGDFLATLLNVKSIKLDDSIFASPIFASLHDSSIELTPDGTEGRPNPFAPIGTDILPVINTVNNALIPTAPAPATDSSVAPVAPSDSGTLTQDTAPTETPAPTCPLKLSATGLDPLLDITLTKGKSLTITASGYSGPTSKISWVVDDTTVTTVSVSTGKSIKLKAVDSGSTQLTVTDNAATSDCSVSIPVTIN